MDRLHQPEIPLLKLALHVEVVATERGLLVRYTGPRAATDLSIRDQWAEIEGLTDRGKILAQYVEGLILEELVSSEEGGLRIAFKDLSKLGELSADFLDGAFELAKLSIRIETSGTVGKSDFKFVYDFLRGRQIVTPHRVGPFLLQREVVYRLSQENFELLDEVDEFNSLEEKEKRVDRVWSSIVNIKRLGENCELSLNISRQEIIRPQKITVDIKIHDNGHVSLFPLFDGVSPELSREGFFRFNQIQTRYNFDPDGTNRRRIRVLIPEEMIPILQDIQRVRRVGGAERDRVLADPMSCFSDGVERDYIEVIDFAPRVKGICHIPQKAQILINAKSRNWSGVAEDEESSKGLADSPEVMRVKRADEDGFDDIPLTHSQFREFANKVNEARFNNSAKVVWHGSNIFIDEELLNNIKRVEGLLAARDKPDFNLKRELKTGVFLDIHQNFEDTNYLEEIESELESAWRPAELPRSLRENIVTRDGEIKPLELMPHQLEGLAWLQNMFRNRITRGGCLLADDMGLGKTLQILTFLAWCIEKEYKRGLGASEGPYEPILIVAPIMLLKTWRDEMQRFFREDESGVFYGFPGQERVIVLHGENLKLLGLVNKVSGRETKDGKLKLNLDEICAHRVVITNYDTVKNYQHSFGKIQWSIIVTDEAQEFKVENQKSSALKALKAYFRIVSTGTPVENRLLDLWNLVDYMQPGALLGSARDFHNRYEKDLGERSAGERRQVSDELKKILRFGQPKAFILRREKGAELKDLPSKTVKPIICEMTDALREEHLRIVSQFHDNKENRENEENWGNWENRGNRDKKDKFGLLHRLKKLYLHPRLLNDQHTLDDEEALIAESPKIQRMIEVVEQIRGKREKVLIFAILHDLQHILARVLERRFGLRIDIISGASGVMSQSSGQKKEDIISKFENKEGFNILILSPKVAGVGLTITAANHVIHYERWWNPAKEAQATDRVYRIGQKKDVFVYNLITRDPRGEIVTFDEKLNELLMEKSELARDFLAPLDGEEAFTQRFYEELRGRPRSAQQGEGRGDGTDEHGTNEPGTGVYGTSIKRRRPFAIKTLADVDELSPHEFEALVALLFIRSGIDTILCPKVGDGQCDVLLVEADSITFIQCKHTKLRNKQGSKAIKDLEEAPGYYRKDILSERQRSLRIKRIACTNYEFDEEVRDQARSLGIELIEGVQLGQLLQKFAISTHELEQMDGRRMINSAQVRRALHGM